MATPILLTDLPLESPGESIQQPSLHIEDHTTSDLDIDQEPLASAIQQLDPVDGGPAAWKALIAAFIFEALLWGFPVCFGVFQEYYSSLPAFASSTSNIALIGTISQGIPFVGGPVMVTVTKRFPKYRKKFIFYSWCICILSLVLGSLSSDISVLIATQGVMYGVGFMMMYWPIFSIVNEWWVARKGFAVGLITSAAGGAGAVLPFAFQAGLRKYGYRITLRATAVALVVVTGPIIPLFKPRLPVSEQTTLARMDWMFLKKPLFWIYCLSMMIQGLGFFFPPLYLPSYAVDSGLSATMGALLLSLMAIAQFLGQTSFGFWSDRLFTPHTLGMACSIVTTVAAALLWGLGKTLPPLAVFSLTYGFFGYGFIATKTAMAKAVTNDQSSVFAVQAVLVFCVGIGNLMVGPISKSLIIEGVMRQQYGLEKYKSVVIFTSSCMLASAGLLVIPYLLRQR